MDREQVLGMLAILAEAYPKLMEGKTAQRLEATANLWHMMLSEYPEQVVMHAVKLHLRESVYVPTPADIIQRIEAMRQVDKDDTEELWAKLVRAVCNSAYNAQAMYDALPYACQRFVGSAQELRNMGQMDEDILRTVTRGQFMRRVEALKAQEKIIRDTPPDILAIAQALSGGFGRIEDTRRKSLED